MDLEIYCDMDGVLCDFVGHAAPLFGETAESLVNKSRTNCYWIFEDTLGIKPHQFWEVVDKYGRDFWAKMPAYPWAKYLFDELNKRGDVYILSSPAPNYFCAGAKQEWLDNFVGKGFYDRFIPTKHKHLLAAPHRMLVDDYEDNCTKFGAAGGNYITFPQHWTPVHQYKNDPVKYTLGHLDEAIKNLRMDGIIGRARPVLGV